MQKNKDGASLLPADPISEVTTEPLPIDVG
jgi:hypothetical protein